MRAQMGWVMMALLSLSACQNFTPSEKVATYDTEREALVMPYPCPDWSQTQDRNYLNELHSNFGCAVNTNLAVQLEDPKDLYRGHGDSRPDPDVRARYLTRYYSGEIPEPLTPLQSTGTGQ